MFDAKKLLDTLIGAASEGTAGARERVNEVGASDFGQSLQDIFGQATDGVRQGASELGERSGAGNALNDVIEQFGGGSAGELLDQAKQWAGDNQLAAGGILGGLGAILIGTQRGRSVATGAAKLGGLALIAGLAYKAYQNHQAGRPLIDSRQDAPEAPPEDSAYAVGHVGDTDAELFLRAMIAGAAADGHIDAQERVAILNGVRDAGMDSEAAAFLEQEFSSPASVEDLADRVTSQHQAAQVYTAARMTIGGDNADERAFLERLGYALDLEATHVAHIDAEVAGVQV
ncbi:MAG: DUF533 domain-containing protein [Pseudomonadota bacterium]